MPSNFQCKSFEELFWILSWIIESISRKCEGILISTAEVDGFAPCGYKNADSYEEIYELYNFGVLVPLVIIVDNFFLVSPS